MGLPLYVAPTEAQRRHKANCRPASPHVNSSILRAYRQSPNTLRESRRRRVLATVAAHNLSQFERQREQDEAHEQERRREQGIIGLPNWPPADAGEQILQQFLERARQPELTRTPGTHISSSSEVPPRWRPSFLSEDALGAAEPEGNAARSPRSLPPPRNHRPASDDTVSPSDLWGPQTQAAFGQGPSSPSNILYDIYHSATGANDGNLASSRSYGLDGQVDHAFDDFLGESNGDNGGNLESIGRRQTFSSRLIRHTSSLRRSHESAPTRRSVVGWSDHDPIGRLRRSSPARNSARANASNGNGDAGNIDGHQDNSSSAAANRRRAWEIRYYEPHPLPSIRTILGNQVDGLGDRSRSLSPEGDGAWDTLLTTLTPDPQPPSLGSSFASTTAPAPAARTSSASPTNGARTGPPAIFPREPVPAVVSPPAGSFTSGDLSSTSANTSQRVRSPFTVVSASTDTADESTILPETTGLDGDLAFAPDVGQEPGCEDSEMDGEDQYLDMTRNHRTLFFNGRGESQPWETRAFVSFAGGHDIGNSSGGDTGNISRDHSHSRSRGRGLANGNNSSNNGDELLERLGISGMLNIVRNLARREDIPDELWAEAGLSRTLGRGTSS
ncbi:hypothetical protein CMQ_6296 [Grosmannia clavigera kw1407]|uniref:Uncharacterized protein n=1 Tax=Grosmannia clavigera (strain kw1407 / UAMH 11150) TaxID=655863 RepID=F0XMD5_GROCL|nr:uncharacterized protein CMQ_6296 [Grosmannia clavigera kw1407]EFX01354.1 hypothetical protein CMQ_6296 [Grosmannia clavigera kw1407]